MFTSESKEIDPRLNGMNFAACCNNWFAPTAFAKEEICHVQP
jgi:hypothetical protein